MVKLYVPDVPDVFGVYFPLVTLLFHFGAVVSTLGVIVYVAPFASVFPFLSTNAPFVIVITIVPPE